MTGGNGEVSPAKAEQDAAIWFLSRCYRRAKPSLMFCRSHTSARAGKAAVPCDGDAICRIGGAIS